ncbi:hypothetical protein BC777_2470 [Yoonia maricola]|uniref:Uncharacterized protein n=1 Tax=Yoonia maricola TaxID=420999 RepID=A0A2M8W5B5_9RHOB|nr:hypothetical protein [Yoonia maricola]PJI86112.1 hypothetical protein BC777_2470 [Yoonia maricola]
MRGIAILLLQFLPLLAHAAPLRVQTGEHATFTRVVVGIPRDIDWELGRTNEGYLLRLPVQEGFVLDQFYDLIPRDRINAVSQNPRDGELRLDVSCDCHAQAVVYQSDYLVIDIRDGPAPSVSPFERALLLEQPVPSEVEPPQLTVPTFQIVRDAVLPVITPRFPVGREEPTVAEPIEITRAVTTPDVSATPDRNTDQALQMIAQALGESLGQGLSEGLLQEGPRVGVGEIPGDPSAIVAGAPLPGLNARTSIDPLAVADRAPQPQTQEGQTCLPDSSFDVAAWGDDRPPHLQLRQARGALTTPADQFDEGALLALARLYVHLGFGHEAQQVLDLEGVQSRDRILLRALARMIDGEPVAAELFPGQVSCPSQVALWALLAQPSAPIDAEVDRTAVINAYRALPTYVQQPIAPRLAEALLTIGAEDAAMQVLGRQTTSKDDDVALALADAALSGALGEEAEAVEKVANVARNDRRTNPEAMTRFFVEGATAQVAFSDADFLLADALRFESGDTPAAAALADAQFDAYLSVDRFWDARALLQARAKELSAAESAQSRATLFQQATARLADAAFLEFIWQENFDQDGVETQNAVGARLLALDFPTQALAVLIGEASGTLAAEQANLRAQAMRQSAAQQAIPDNNSQSAVGRDSTDQTETSDVMVAGNATLRNSRALVESAEQSRETIRALLQTVPAPAEF